jgi:hypothetical protein
LLTVPKLFKEIALIGLRILLLVLICWLGNAFHDPGQGFFDFFDPALPSFSFTLYFVSFSIKASGKGFSNGNCIPHFWEMPRYSRQLKRIFCS